MAGSNIFVIYADAEGTNVTLSPRLGTGEVEPLEDMTADVTLLGGSGIADGVMTANVKCEFWNNSSLITSIQPTIATITYFPPSS